VLPKDFASIAEIPHNCVTLFSDHKKWFRNTTWTEEDNVLQSTCESSKASSHRCEAVSCQQTPSYPWFL